MVTNNFSREIVYVITYVLFAVYIDADRHVDHLVDARDHVRSNVTARHDDVHRNDNIWHVCDNAVGKILLRRTNMGKHTVRTNVLRAHWHSERLVEQDR